MLCLFADTLRSIPLGTEQASHPGVSSQADICQQVSEFAPPSLQKPLSYVVGWSCCLGWIAGVPSCCVQLGGMVQTMVLLVHPDANVSELWQSTLLLYCFLLLAVGFNIVSISTKTNPLWVGD